MIVLWIYLVGVVLAWLPSARFLIRMDSGFGGNDTMDYVGAVLIGFVFAWCWPLFLPGAYVYTRLRASEDEPVDEDEETRRSLGMGP